MPEHHDATRSRLVPEELEDSDEELHMEDEDGGLISLKDLSASDHVWPVENSPFSTPGMSNL